jgi:hypothetical protein
MTNALPGKYRIDAQAPLSGQRRLVVVVVVVHNRCCWIALIALIAVPAIGQERMIISFCNSPKMYFLPIRSTRLS